jgi:hypothetical protein
MPTRRYDIPWADYADENKDARPSASQDNYTFTEDGLRDGVSVGRAENLTPIDPKYRSSQQPGYDIPWSQYADKGNGTSASPVKDTTEPFTGSSYDDVTKYLERQLSEYRQLEETDEDRKKRERREGRQRRLAAIGDILGSMHRAYSHARGVEPIRAANVSDKVQARIDRARAERDRISDRVISLSAALDRLNRSRDEADYRKRSLDIRQQQQDRLAKIAEADADLKLARIDKFNSDREIREAESAVKIKLMEAGINEKEANARAKELVANSTAAKNYALAEKAKRDNGSSSSHAGEVKITETTDKYGNKSVSRTHYEPEQKEVQKKEEKVPATPKPKANPNPNKNKPSSNTSQPKKKNGRFANFSIRK